MSVTITASDLARLTPSARSSYRQAFANGQEVLDRYGISASNLRVAHFMAQVLHESGGLTIQFENLNYSAKRLPQVWPSRFKPKGPLNPAEYANNPQKLANEVYGGRMGNTAPNDGFTYRGRGMIQITGKDGYASATKNLRKDHPEAPDFVANPDEVISAAWSLAVAASIWSAKGCNRFADEDSINKVTRAINGGLTGIGDRTDWLRKTKAVWP